MKKILCALSLMFCLTACVVDNAGSGDNAPEEADGLGSSPEVVDAGVVNKDVTSQAKAACKAQCDYHYNEQNCTQTDTFGWYSGCYSFCEGYVNDMDLACRDEFRNWQQCEHDFIWLDPAPPGNGYLWGNDGCWTCGGEVDPNAWPVLQCDRCAFERNAYYNCI